MLTYDKSTRYNLTYLPAGRISTIEERDSLYVNLVSRLTHKQLRKLSQDAGAFHNRSVDTYRAMLCRMIETGRYTLVANGNI